jgi:HlyD family secretion protein
MAARFSVDAFPGEVFSGWVSQIRLNAQMTQNVVTYPVVVTFDNPDERVLPYLTANVQFEVDQRRNVLLVPNVALRWKPRPDQVAPEVRETAAASFGKSGGKEGPPAARPPGDPKSAKPAKDQQDRGRIWVKQGDSVRPVQVQIGATDGSLTEVSGEEAEEGMEVVTGENRPEQVAENSKNPFAPPQIPRGGQRKGPPPP